MADLGPIVKSLKITDNQYSQVRDRLLEKYGPTILISRVSRKTLGCTFRRDRYTVFVDFWEERYKSLFILKWLSEVKEVDDFL